MNDMALGRPYIELNRVTLGYGHGKAKTVALAETDMEIAQGEFIAVVGPSGCGKSSLLKLVSGLKMPEQGDVTVGGERVTAPLKTCGMAFQNSTLLPWRTLLDNVLLPLEIVQPHGDNFRKDRARYEGMAHALLRTVGLGDFSSKYPWELSGGMQQRASLCRALVHEPRQLLLDEPFGALDQFTREELWNIVQQLWMEKKPTVVLVTHDLREAVYLADTVYVFSPRPGRILSRTHIPLPRPRTAETMYLPEFVELTHALREQIHPQ